MVNWKIVFCLVLCFLATDSIARRHYKPYHRRDNSPGLNGISVSAGYYNPSMEYLNKWFLPMANTSNRFKGGAMGSANLSFDLPLNLGTRLGIWYWDGKVNGQTGSTFNHFGVNFTGVSMGAFYSVKGSGQGLIPYFGIDGTYLMIQEKYDANDMLMKMVGTDIVTTPFIGINTAISDKIFIGIEYGYCIGQYLHDIELPTGIVSEPVKINGNKIQFTVGYKFR